jgi:ketosteroid isomerase-like protein
MENEKNIQTIQQLYADFGSGNLEGILNALTDDISWTDPGYPDIPYAGKRNGKKEVQDYFEKLLNTITFTEFDPQEFYADKDAVIVKGSFSGKLNSTGKTVGDEWVMIWKFANGKIYFYRLWTDTLAVARSME